MSKKERKITNKELREGWNEKVKQLPPVDEEKLYHCKGCDKDYTLETALIDIGSYGVDVECPECPLDEFGDRVTIGFEPLGYSKFE